MEEQHDSNETRPGDEPEALSAQEALAEKNKGFGKKLLIFIAVMFLFGWVSIPLYRIVCEKIDPGGSSWQNGEVEEYKDVVVDESRTVRVRFAAEVNRQLPWTFRPTERSVEVHPGEKRLTKFISKNLDPQHEITGQGVYDINPPEAAPYFKKIECFCFKEQTLAAGEEVDMPLYFWFDPELPEHVKDITIAYTFFNADSSRSRSQKGTSTVQR